MRSKANSIEGLGDETLTRWLNKITGVSEGPRERSDFARKVNRTFKKSEVEAEMIRHNFGYKLMALAVAFALWSYVNTERNPQARRTFTVPIEVAHVADGYAAEPDVRDANVTVQGTEGHG